MVNGQEVKTTNSATDDLALQRFMEKASELQDVLTELWGMANMLADSGYDADVALVQANDGCRPWLKTVTHWDHRPADGRSLFSVNCNVSKTFVEFVPLEDEDDTDGLPL